MPAQIGSPWMHPELVWISADQPWNMNGVKESWSCLEYVALLFGQHDFQLFYTDHGKCDDRTLDLGVEDRIEKTWKILLVKPNWDFTWQICKNWMNCFHDLNDVLVQWYIVKQRAAKLENNTSNHLPQPAVPGIYVRNNGTRAFKEFAGFRENISVWTFRIWWHEFARMRR